MSGFDASAPVRDMSAALIVSVAKQKGPGSDAEPL
jgi:hypothetical protein